MRKIGERKVPLIMTVLLDLGIICGIHILIKLIRKDNTNKNRIN